MKKKEPRRYGQWAGNEKGRPEDVERCIVEVYPKHGYVPGQCSRKRGHGTGGLYCKQHAKREGAR